MTHDHFPLLCYVMLGHQRVHCWTTHPKNVTTILLVISQWSIHRSSIYVSALYPLNSDKKSWAKLKFTHISNSQKEFHVLPTHQHIFRVGDHFPKMVVQNCSLRVIPTVAFILIHSFTFYLTYTLTVHLAFYHVSDILAFYWALPKTRSLLIRILITSPCSGYPLVNKLWSRKITIANT